MTTDPRAGIPQARTGWLPIDPLEVPPEAVAVARVASAAAAAVLTLTSTGSAVVAGAVLAVALADRRGAVAVAAVVVAASLRWGSTGLDEWASVQSVLGTGVEVGPISGATSAWLCLVALVLAVGPRPAAQGVGAVARVVSALAVGGLGAAAAVGPGPDGDLWKRAVAVAVVAALSYAASSGRWGRSADLRRRLSVVAGLAAVVAAGWPT